MTRHVLLNNIEHKDLKVITRHSADFGDNVHAVLTFPTEYGDIQREYPIFFRKDPDSDEYQSVAILGFEKGENLFLEEGRWNASYVPAIVARGPFLIGFQDQEVDGELRKEPVIHVDLDDPRVNENEGEPVFRKHGGNTPYVDRIARMLRGIHEGMAMSAEMFRLFDSYELIRPVSIDVDLYTDQRITLNGFYSIDQQRLSGLDGAALEALNKSGFLEGAYLVIASLNNVKKMIDMKNRRSERQARAAAE
jgi:SapC